MNATAKVDHLLLTFFAIGNKYGKRYSYASLVRLQYLLDVHHGDRMSISSLSRRIEVGVEGGYFHRRQRTKDCGRLGKMFTSSLTTIGHKGYHRLGKMGFNVWKDLREVIVNGKKKFESVVRARKKESGDEGGIFLPGSGWIPNVGKIPG